MIPDFPKFKTLEYADREELHGYLVRYPEDLSDYTFTNLFAWQKSLRYSLCRYGNGFLVRSGGPGAYAFMQPLVPEGQAEAARACLDYLAGKNCSPVIRRVGEKFVAALEQGLFRVSPARDAFDYVYRVSDLVGLKGEEYHAKLNLWNQFTRRHPDYVYRAVDEDMVGDCIDFIHRWCLRRNCDKKEGMNWEKCAAIRILRYLPHLGAFGGVIEIAGRIEALALGEPLNPATLVVHVEKADERIRGLYQAINREFLRHNGSGFEFVNREEDLGVPGLRKAKKSYRPCRMVKKFHLEPVGESGSPQAF